MGAKPTSKSKITVEYSTTCSEARLSTESFAEVGKEGEVVMCTLYKTVDNSLEFLQQPIL